MLVARVASGIIWIRGHRPRFARLERGGFLRNPHSLPRASCANPFTHVLAQASLDEVGEGDFFVIPTSCRWHLVQIFSKTHSLKQAWTHSY